MSFVKNFKGEDKSPRETDRVPFKVYPFERAKRDEIKNSLYFRRLADEQSINVGKRSSLSPPTSDQAFFYPVLYEQN